MEKTEHEKEKKTYAACSAPFHYPWLIVGFAVLLSRRLSQLIPFPQPRSGPYHSKVSPRHQETVWTSRPGTCVHTSLASVLIA